MVELFSAIQADATGVAVTITGQQSGDTATGTVDTVGGEISGGVTITSPGTSFIDGETVTIAEDGEQGRYTAIATITP